MSALPRLAAWLALAAAAFAAAPALAQSSASDFTSATRYDGMGRVTGTIAPDPDGPSALRHAAVRNTYDGAGRLTKVEQGQLEAWQSEAVAPSAWSGFTIYTVTELAYDALDRKVREQVGDGTSVSKVAEYRYDTGGQLECTIVRMNPSAWATPRPDCTPGRAHAGFGPDRVTRSYYDADGRLVQLREGVGTAAERPAATYSYNDDDQRLSLTDARGFRAEMTYDGHGRQKRWIFPSKTTTGLADTGDYEEYGYDPNGNRLSLRKRDGSTILYQYDALNRLVWKVVPERSGLTAAQTRDVAYQYDLRGLQTLARFDSMEGPGLHNVYDGFGRLVSARNNLGGVNRILDYAYDADGNRIRITHPDGVQFNYAWEGMDRLRAVNDNASYQAIDDSILSKVYDPQGTNGLLLWGNGNAMFVHARFFDGIGRQTYLGYDLPGTSNDLSYALGYNPASQVTSQVRSNPAFAWTGSVPVNRNYAVNGQNQYETAGPASFTYDANGNLISDGATTYVYDVENRLVSATGATNASLVYDPLGRLWETSGGSAGVTRFLYDGDELAAEYDGSGTLLRRYVHGNLADDPVALYEGSSLGPANRAYIQTDTQGSVVALINGNGTLRSRNTYDEYGIPGAANAGRFQYTGQAWIPELGMYYYKARIYSPTLGRFMQVDPIGYEDQINLYAYVGDDPINKTDPDGQEGVFEWIADSAKMVAHDLANLGEAIADGDLGYAFGGMPPTLGGGLGSGLATATGASARVASAVARDAAVSRAAAGQLRNATSVASRTTAAGERAVKVTNATGRVRDISPTRVKEYIPVTHPKAPPGTMQRVRFPNPQAGSKGFKRAPTPVEHRMTEIKPQPGIICRYTGYLCGR